MDSSSQGPVVTGDPSLQDQILEDLAEAKNYRRWLTGLARPWLGDDPLEIGSGSGDYAEEWASAGFRFTASEAEPGRVAALQERFREHPLISVRELTVPIEEDGDHSAIVSYNVLEHIPDDVLALRGMSRLVRPGGYIVLIVPAFPIAMSAFDREIGHQRRYLRTTLADVADQAGLDVVKLHYVNAVGLFSWLVVVKALGSRPRAGFALRSFDRVVPLLQRIETRWVPPFGQSLLLVAQTRAVAARA